MDVRLGGGEETCAHPGTGGAEGEHRGEPAPVSYSASGRHWNRRDRINYPGHERECRNRPPDVTARLPALRDDDIGARSRRGSTFLRGADGGKTIAPASRASPLTLLASPQKKETIRTPAASTAASRSR
jgi:hypothetical protein